ncbi:MAG: DEAD/DEAH box helicase family protein [Desulfosporosinus sp.]|nr:DEAD/DEAH box helicase family protein [Desulfosporosinus sp.]
MQDGPDLIIPRGFINELKEILRKQGIDPGKVIAYRQVVADPVDFGSWNENYTLRDYQVPAVEAAVSSGSGGVVVAPAGSGKTIVGLKAMQEIRQPTLWLTHTQDLMYQTAKKASEVLQNVGQVGIIGDGKVAYGSGKLTVALVQALAENPKIIEGIKPLIGMVIIDEAHHFPAPAFVDIAGQFPAAKMLGLTATPERKDMLECYMFRGIGPKLHTIARDGLYDAGALIKPEVRFNYTDFQYEQGSDRNHALDNVDAGGKTLTTGLYWTPS